MNRSHTTQTHKQTKNLTLTINKTQTHFDTHYPKTKAIAEQATTDKDRDKVTAICKHMAKLKLGKFDSIYDEYA